MSEKKFGLILPKSKASSSGSKSNEHINKSLIPPSIFEREDDENDVSEGWQLDKGRKEYLLNEDIKHSYHSVSSGTYGARGLSNTVSEHAKGKNITNPPSTYAQPSHFRMKQIEDQKEKALKEDPNIFDYDAAFDSFHSRNVKKKDNEEVNGLNDPKKPKYISNLLKKAEERKLENELILERKIQKEREAEGDLFRDKEKFVTSGYKKKLQELKKWEEEQKKKDQGEEDIKKDTGLIDFYSSILNERFDKDERSGGRDVSVPISHSSLLKKSEGSSSGISSTLDGPSKNDSLHSTDEGSQLVSFRIREKAHLTSEAPVISSSHTPSSSVSPDSTANALLGDYKQRYLERKSKSNHKK